MSKRTQRNCSEPLERLWYQRFLRLQKTLQLGAVLIRHFKDVDSIADLRIACCDHAFGRDFLIIDPQSHLELGSNFEREHGFDVAAAKTDFAGGDPQGRGTSGMSYFERKAGLYTSRSSAFAKTIGSHSAASLSLVARKSPCASHTTIPGVSQCTYGCILRFRGSR